MKGYNVKIIDYKMNKESLHREKYAVYHCESEDEALTRALHDYPPCDDFQIDSIIPMRNKDCLETRLHDPSKYAILRSSKTPHNKAN